jgi:microcystin-dependent protein
MAIQWGSYESSGIGIRLGLDVAWDAVQTSDDEAHLIVKIYSQNTDPYNDSQVINYSNQLDNNFQGRSSISFTNNDGTAAVQRDLVSFFRDYSDSSYGESPGTWTLVATLSGAFNGVTPTISVTTTIPARPIAAPNPPTNGEVARVSSTAHKITWSNKSIPERPWESVLTRVQTLDGDYVDLGTTSGSSTSITDSVLEDRKYRYAVRSSNSKGSSAWDYTSYIYTAPAPPLGPARYDGPSGAQQTVSWKNKSGGYDEFSIEVWRAQDGVYALLATIAHTGLGSSQSYIDTTANAAKKTKYKLRAKTTTGIQGTLYSAYTGETTETAGITSAPFAPTNLAPNGSIISPTTANTFSWKYNTSDTTAQTKEQIQWRVVGAPAWTIEAEIASSSASASMAANTFPDNSEIEWQVRTKGAHVDWSPWSVSALVETVGNPNTLRERIRLVRLDLSTGKTETAPVGVLPPIGSITMFGGITAPAGWLLCDGTVLSRKAYPDLFGVIGTLWNTSGETADQFRLPNFRGRTAVGFDGSTEFPAVGKYYGTKTHTHPLSDDGAAKLASNTTSGFRVQSGAATGSWTSEVFYAATRTVSNVTHSFGIGLMGNTDSQNSFQPSGAVQYIIKI